VARVSSGVTASESARPPASAPTVARSEAVATPAPKATTPLRAEAPKPDAPKTEAAKADTPKADTKRPEADDGARARALLEGQAADGKSTAVAAAEPGKAAANGARFVVQVGSYGGASSARDMRQRVDKLGLKSYTQETEVDGVKRIRVRVGPFNSRDDAEKAAGTLKAAGLPAAIMTL
jgi:DedD protein